MLMKSNNKVIAADNPNVHAAKFHRASVLSYRFGSNYGVKCDVIILGDKVNVSVMQNNDV